MSDIILASKSPYRKELLQRLGIEFKCVAPEYDERPLKDQITDPQELSRQLSLQKALAVQAQHPHAIIIGSDQVCWFDGDILGKTQSFEKSLGQLKKMQGKEHQLITSYVILYNDRNISHTEITTLNMRELTENQIKKYLSCDKPFDCAGSYKLELNGITLFKKITTHDHTAIIGLPLLQLTSDLNKLGVVIPPEA